MINLGAVLAVTQKKRMKICTPLATLLAIGPKFPYSNLDIQRASLHFGQLTFSVEGIESSSNFVRPELRRPSFEFSNGVID